MPTSIFCEACGTLLLQESVCAACGWERPPTVRQPGALDPDPVPLGGVLSGQPACFEDAVWYAALPASREEAGTLVSVHRSGTIVRRHDLAAFMPPPARPVADTVSGGDHVVFVGLRDYAFGEQRPPKSLLALEPRSGQVAWQLATPSRELSAPVRRGESLYLSGTSPDAIYAVDVANAVEAEGQRLHWQAAVDVDSRFRPAVAEAAVVVLAGPLVGERTLTALAREDGRERWRIAAPAGAGQPVAAAGLVAVPGMEAVHAYDAGDGREQWRYEPERATSRGTATAPPVVVGGRLLLPTGADGGYALDALDMESGERCWRFRLPVRRRIKVAPAVLGNVVVVGNGAGDLYALDVENGNLLWQKEIPAGLAAVPVSLADWLLLPGRDGLLYRLAWKREAPRPAEAPSALEASGEWEEAAVAYALADPPDLSRAGRCFLRAEQAERALKLFEAAGDEVGAADALAAQGQLAAALERLPPGAEERRARWLAEMGRHEEAAGVLASLERWEEAGAAYEQAGEVQKAVEAYQQAAQEEKVQQLIVRMGSAGTDQLVEAVGWEAALFHYRQAGDEEAVSALVDAHVRPELETARAEEDWERVRDLCREIGDWRGAAEACLELAEAVPRREVRAARAPEARASETEEGLPPDLYRRLRDAFEASDYFESDRRLRALFSDRRVAAWRSRLRDAESIEERVDAAIDLLYDQVNRSGDNGLLLLTTLLAERLDPGDATRGQLEELSAHLGEVVQGGERARTELVPLPEAYEWWARAGEIYAEHGAWQEAEESFRQARHHVRWAEVLAQQGRWEEAGELLHAERVAFEQAAAYYWQAAQTALADRPSWQKRALRAASLFQRAQECFLFCGDLEGLLLCRTEADRSLARPRLLLGDGLLARPMQQGVVSRFTLPLYNVGFGPATGVQVWAYGNALERKRDEAEPVGALLPVLVAGGETEVALTVEPQATAHESIPLEIDLLIRYRDVEDVEQEEGPYTVHQPVLPASAVVEDGAPAPIRPHHEGTYFDTAEQVRIIRAVRETGVEEAPVETALTRLGERLREGPEE